MLASLDDSPSLLLAVNEYVSARKTLGDNHMSLTDVVKEHRRRSHKIEKQIKVCVLVEEFLRFKEKQNLSH